MSASCSLAATIRRAGLVFVLLIVRFQRFLDFARNDKLESDGVSPIPKSGSANFQLFSQDPVQQDKQYERGHDKYNGVEGEHADRNSEIAFLETEKYIRLIAAAVIVL